MKNSLKSKHTTPNDVIPQKCIILDTTEINQHCTDNSTATMLYNEKKIIPKSLEMDQKELPVDSLGLAYSKEIRPFIDVIDNLRQFGLQQDIGLPNVVVVGDQSSGKSSIIESISGIQLPRGIGIVTRCPLELQLKRVIDKPWRALLKYKTLDEDILITKPNEVEQFVLEAQDQICKPDKGVSKELITLKIESPARTAPDLTLIDLPGIARTAVAGQPENICDQIRNIIIDYVKNENAVILCVISANLDAAVNESINIAKQYDPLGRRTLGVITKPDMAEEANKEDVLCLLNNRKIRLEKGFHMVKCRSQKELGESLSLEQSIENEKIFFENDNHFKTAKKSQLGIPYLAVRITKELVEVIKKNLPGLKEQISTLLQQTTEERKKLPKEIPDDKQQKLTYLIGVIGDTNHQIQISLHNGKNVIDEDNLFHHWRRLFNDMKMEIDQIKDNAMKTKFSEHRLQEEISKKRGNEISGFLNHDVFEGLIKNHVSQYKQPAITLLSKMKTNTDDILKEIIQKYFKHLPIVESQLKQMYLRELDTSKDKAEHRIDIIFEEENLILTLDESFEREMKLLKEGENCNGIKIKFEKKNALMKNAKRLLKIIKCYLKIVHNRLSDQIPMTIRQCLHVELCETLKEQFNNYSTSVDVESQVRENEMVQEERQMLKNKIGRLQNARLELSKI